MDEDRRARLRLAAQNGAARALMENDTVEVAVPAVLGAVCESLGWTVGQLWRRDPETGALRLDTLWTDPAADVGAFNEATRRVSFDPGVGLPGRVSATGEPAWIGDVAEDPNFPRKAAAEKAGLRAGVAVPVRVRQELWGVLEFFVRRPMEPDPELLDTLASVGAHLGLFIERRQTEESLRESEERFRTFAQAIPDATVVMDADSRIVYVNQAVRTIFGYEPEELIGQPMTVIMPERHRHPHIQAVDRFMATGERRIPWDGVILEGLRKDGTEVPLEISFGTYEREGRRFFTGVVRDITERNRAAERVRFQANLLDAVGEAVIATDLDGRILYWNAFAERLYGWRADEVVGREIAEVTPAPPSREVAREILQTLRRGEPWTGEFLVRNRDGREFPVLVNDSPILDGDGNLMGTIGTSTEITDRKRREEAQRFLAEAGEVLASTLDYTATLRTVAKLAVSILGDWCMVHVVPEEGRDPQDSPVQVARAGSGPGDEVAARLEGMIRGRPDVIERVMRSRAPILSPARASNGPPSPLPLPPEELERLGCRSLLMAPLRARDHALGVMTFCMTSDRGFTDEDILLAEELARRSAIAIDNARLYREAEEGNRAKSDFLAVVSHELRTPLNAITGYTDLIGSGVAGEVSEKQQRFLDRIRVGSRHLTHIIDEILAFARLESGREPVEVEPTDVGQVARDAAVVVSPGAEDRGLDLDVDIPEPGPQILTDPGKLRQVLVNLLNNAVKYTNEGGIRLEVASEDDGARITVEDTGIGIGGAEQKRIFEPFWQAQSPNTRTAGGTGLGLAVSRRFVDLLGGTISVESEPGKGSTFTVRLPARAPTRGEPPAS